MITAFATKLGASGNNIRVEVEFKLADDSGLGPVTIDIPIASVTAGADLKSLLPSRLATFCTNNGIDNADAIVWLSETGGWVPAGLSSAPQAAISAGATNAATNLPTNYNVLSGLLGVADGLNGGNAAQNDLATKYNALATKLNSLLSHLQTLGLQA